MMTGPGANLVLSSLGAAILATASAGVLAGEPVASPVVVVRGCEQRIQSMRPAIDGSIDARPVENDGTEVIVMRPASGSFLRETARLAAAAEAREERSARAAERRALIQVAAALQALHSIAADSRYATPSAPWRPFLVTTGHPGGDRRMRPRAPVASTVSPR